MKRRFELKKVRVNKADVSSAVYEHEGEVYYAIKDNKHFISDIAKQTYGIIVGDVSMDELAFAIAYANQMDLIPHTLTENCISWEFDYEVELEEI